MRAWVILPPEYDALRVHAIPPSTGHTALAAILHAASSSAASSIERMAQDKMPPMIWVMLDESCSTGTHEFADSVNNGPWGTALTDRIHSLSREADTAWTRASTGRFLQGHSSGGWATLQLQINYPQIFGGTWSTSPDPSDFHDFTGVDLYAPARQPLQAPRRHALPARPRSCKCDRHLRAVCPDRDASSAPMAGSSLPSNGSFRRAASDGRPLPMFNRDTGDVDPAVVAYWHDHYDLAHIVASNLGPARPLAARQDSRLRRHRRHLLPRRRGAQDSTRSCSGLTPMPTSPTSPIAPTSTSTPPGRAAKN